MVTKVCHWGPLLALGIIKLVSWTTVHCMTLWLSCTESIQGITNAVIFFGLAILTIYNFLCSMFVGPGFVPLNWRPKKVEDKRYLQYCLSCNGYKAPRSHHCRRCGFMIEGGRCVLKMDHHCPWINNCVGHLNHRYFIMFLFFSICGSIHACSLLILTLYKLFIDNVYYTKEMPSPMRLSLTWFILCVFSIGMSLGVFFALSFLLYIQMKSTLYNRTGIEDWIIEKADERRNNDPTIPYFVHPYDLGWKKNFLQVFNDSGSSNGILWEVRHGCSEYDLTIEQLQQKEWKKLRKKPFKVVKQYSGAIFPLVNGFCACIRPPFTMEKRIELNLNEVILVTRYQKYWMFGEKNTSRMKGWFPKSCVVDITDYQNCDDASKLKKEI